MSLPYQEVIEPQRGFFRLDWRAVLRSRELVPLLIKREFAASYKQTLLGSLWFILNPLLSALVLTLVFNRIMEISTGGAPVLLFYLCGLLLWNFFSQSTEGIVTGIRDSLPIFNKVYFPRILVPISIVGWRFLSFGAHSLIFLIFYLVFLFAGWRASPSVGSLALVPFLLLQIALLSLGIGLTIASISVKFRDLQQLMRLGMQLWMFVTPVIYPASAVPRKWAFLLLLNPVAPPMERFRQAFFGGAGDLTAWAISALTTIILFCVGVILFLRVEKDCVDIL